MTVPVETARCCRCYVAAQENKIAAACHSVTVLHNWQQLTLFQKHYLLHIHCACKRWAMLDIRVDEWAIWKSWLLPQGRQLANTSPRPVFPCSGERSSCIASFVVWWLCFEAFTLNRFRAGLPQWIPVVVLGNLTQQYINDLVCLELPCSLKKLSCAHRSCCSALAVSTWNPKLFVCIGLRTMTSSRKWTLTPSNTLNKSTSCLFIRSRQHHDAWCCLHLNSFYIFEKVCPAVCGWTEPQSSSERRLMDFCIIGVILQQNPFEQTTWHGLWGDAPAGLEDLLLAKASVSKNPLEHVNIYMERESKYFVSYI